MWLTWLAQFSVTCCSYPGSQQALSMTIRKIIKHLKNNTQKQQYAMCVTLSHDLVNHGSTKWVPKIEIALKWVWRLPTLSLMMFKCEILWWFKSPTNLSDFCEKKLLDGRVCNPPTLPHTQYLNFSLRFLVF